MSGPNDKLSTLLAYVESEGRICPKPRYWNELWEMLPNKNQDDGRWNPSLPLILGAWHDTTNEEKSARLREHIEYAAASGVLDIVDAYLHELTPDLWHSVIDDKHISSITGKD